MDLNIITGVVVVNETEVLSDVYEEAPACTDRLVEYRGLRLVVLRGVFAPYPAFKGRASVTQKNIEMFAGKRVLDLGSGSGVRAVIAGMAGAKEVVATDVDPVACANTEINAQRYNQRVAVACMNLFGALHTRFDSIVSYLPSRDAPISKPEDQAIHDPDFELNFRLINEAPDYLSGGGSLHTSFLDQGQIEHFQSRISQVGYTVSSYTVRPHATGDWHFASLTKP